MKKSRELHPDGDLYKDEDEGTSVNKSHWSYKSKTQSFMELKEAYDVLKKSDTRAEYDSNLYYLESKDGYLMECMDRNNLSNILNLRTPSSNSFLKDVGGHFIDPNELLEREEKNNRFFKVGVCVVFLVIIANVLYVNYLRKKKLNLYKTKNKPLAGLIIE